jgi:hypothetical protein
MPKIIALCGFKQSGKTTVSNHLVKVYGFYCLPFASVLKEMLSVLGLTHEQIYGDRKEVPCDLLGGKTPRGAMQSLGTEWGRDCIDADLWVRAWRNKLKELPMNGWVVVDDLRFPNEAEAIIQEGGKIFLICRDSVRPEGDLHPSEAFAEKLPFHGGIDSNGSVDDLRNTVDDIMKIECPK